MKLLAVLLFAQIALAQFTFQAVTGTQSGLLPNCMQAWYDEEVARGKQGDFWMWTLEAEDFDNDGDVDLFAFSHRVIGGHVCKNMLVETGQLTFVDATHELTSDSMNLPTGDGSAPIFMDWDKDGMEDITGLSDSGYPKTLLNKASGFVNVSPAIRFIQSFEEIGDWSGDGFPDVWGIFHSHGATSWSKREYRFSGTSFQAMPAVPYVAPANAPAEWATFLASLICCDLDGNGYMDDANSPNRYLGIKYHQHFLDDDPEPDLVFKGHSGYNNGAAFGRYCITQPDGSCLESTTQIGLPLVGYPIYIGDLVEGNGDDILIAKGGSASGLYVNNGAGQFTFIPGPLTDALSSSESYLHRVFIEDFDGNGRLDVIANAPRTGVVTVLEQTSPGIFAVVFTASGWDSNPIAVADFNNDGSKDFALGKREIGVDKDIAIYLNTSAPPVPPMEIPTISELPAFLCVGFYDQQIVVLGGVPPYQWEVVSGSLPQGLGLVTFGGNVSISGTHSGTYPFGLRVTDANGQSTIKNFTLPINCGP